MDLRSGSRARENAIGQVVAEVLNVDSVSMSDDPFELGLTSIQAIRVCARIRRELGLEATPESLLDSDTISGFVAAVLGTRNG